MNRVVTLTVALALGAASAAGLAACGEDREEGGVEVEGGTGTGATGTGASGTGTVTGFSGGTTVGTGAETSTGGSGDGY